MRAAASAKPEQVLQQARHDPAALANLRQEWMADTLEKDELDLLTAKGPPTDVTTRAQLLETFDQLSARAKAA